MRRIVCVAGRRYPAHRSLRFRPMTDRFFFRQLLSGRDFATSDPARPPDGQLRVPHRRPRDGRGRGGRPRVRRRRAPRAPRRRGPAPHRRPRHALAPRPRRRRHHGLRHRRASASSRGWPTCTRPCTSSATRPSGSSAPPASPTPTSSLHDSGDIVMVGDIPDHADAHARPHAGQPVLPRRRQARRRRHAVPRRLRPHRPPRRGPRRDVREPHAAARGRPRRHDPVPGPPVLRRAVGSRWARPASATTCSGSTASTSGACSWARERSRGTPPRTDRPPRARPDRLARSATTLVAALLADLEERYGGPDPDEPLADDLAPPHGAFSSRGSAASRSAAAASARPRRPVGEIKRMYVKPGGTTAGRRRAVLAALEDHARALGYGTSGSRRACKPARGDRALRGVRLRADRGATASYQ